MTMNISHTLFRAPSLKDDNYEMLSQDMWSENIYLLFPIALNLIFLFHSELSI